MIPTMRTTIDQTDPRTGQDLCWRCGSFMFPGDIFRFQEDGELTGCCYCRNRVAPTLAGEFSEGPLEPLEDPYHCSRIHHFNAGTRAHIFARERRVTNHDPLRHPYGAGWEG